MTFILSLAVVALAASASALPNRPPKYSSTTSIKPTTTPIKTTTAPPVYATTTSIKTTTTKSKTTPPVYYSSTTAASTTASPTASPFPYPGPYPPNYSVPGYTGVDLNNGAINAPTDGSCHTYITEKVWNDGQPFSPQRCVDACEAETKYNQEYLNSRATCRFVNTYILFKNGVPQSQVCAMYTRAWDASYATNTGYTSGNDKYTISKSWSYSNTQDPGNDKSCVAPLPTTTTPPAQYPTTTTPPAQYPTTTTPLAQYPTTTPPSTYPTSSPTPPKQSPKPQNPPYYPPPKQNPPKQQPPKSQPPPKNPPKQQPKPSYQY